MTTEAAAASQAAVPSAATSGSAALPATPFIRRVLWLSAGFNLVGALAFALPSSVGMAMGLPVAVPPVYAALVTAFVLLFGGLYAWQASQPAILPPLLVLSAIGKASAFAVFLVCGFTGDLPWRGVLLGSGDLLLAAIYVVWLHRHPPGAGP